MLQTCNKSRQHPSTPAVHCVQVEKLHHAVCCIAALASQVQNQHLHKSLPILQDVVGSGTNLALGMVRQTWYPVGHAQRASALCDVTNGLHCGAVWNFLERRSSVLTVSAHIAAIDFLATASWCRNHSNVTGPVNRVQQPDTPNDNVSLHTFYQVKANHILHDAADDIAGWMEYKSVTAWPHTHTHTAYHPQVPVPVGHADTTDKAQTAHSALQRCTYVHG